MEDQCLVEIESRIATSITFMDSLVCVFCAWATIVEHPGKITLHANTNLETVGRWKTKR